MDAMSLIAEALAVSKPKFNWKNCQDAFPQWKEWLRMHRSSGSRQGYLPMWQKADVKSRLIPQILVPDLPAKPVINAGTASQWASYNSCVSDQKAAIEANERSRKMSKEVHEMAIKAIADYGCFHDADSLLMSNLSFIVDSRSRRLDASVSAFSALGLDPFTVYEDFLRSLPNPPNAAAPLHVHHALVVEWLAATLDNHACYVLWAIDDMVNATFKPGQPSQYHFFVKEMQDLRDFHYPIHEVHIRFIELLGFIRSSSSGQPLSDRMIEFYLKEVITADAWRVHVKAMFYEIDSSIIPRLWSVERVWATILSEAKQYPELDVGAHVKSQPTVSSKAYDIDQEVDDRLRRLRSKSPSYGGDSRGGSSRRSRPNSPAYFESGDVKRQRGVDAALEVRLAALEARSDFRTSGGGRGDRRGGAPFPRTPARGGGRGSCVRCGREGHRADNCYARTCDRCGATLEPGPHYCSKTVAWADGGNGGHYGDRGGRNFNRGRGRGRAGGRGYGRG
jgi:hypothetical protein